MDVLGGTKDGGRCVKNESGCEKGGGRDAKNGSGAWEMGAMV